MFTDLSGTPLARTRLPLSSWFLYLRLLEHGHTTSELARALGVKWDTVAAVQRRIGLALGRSGLVHQLRKVAQQEVADSGR
jgi:hypothetical protein